MKPTRLLPFFSLLAFACSTPAPAMDSGRSDSAVSDSGSSPSDSSMSQPDGSSMLDATIADSASAPDGAAPVDVLAASDAAPDRVVLPVDSGLVCTLPSGGTCPAGSSCPAGDGCNTCSCPASGGVALCTDRACPPDAGAGECATAADCRLFESYCSTDPCSCLALTNAAPDPRCGGGMVTCFVPPCRGHSADCVAGRCVVR
ncbi:MAG: hypothetical protein U0269_21380 [Polyangiales bacterium]